MEWDSNRIISVEWNFRPDELQLYKLSVRQAHIKNWSSTGSEILFSINHSATFVMIFNAAHWLSIAFKCWSLFKIACKHSMNALPANSVIRCSTSVWSYWASNKWAMDRTKRSLFPSNESITISEWWKIWKLQGVQSCSGRKIHIHRFRQKVSPGGGVYHFRKSEGSFSKQVEEFSDKCHSV